MGNINSELIKPKQQCESLYQKEGESLHIFDSLLLT